MERFAPASLDMVLPWFVVETLPRKEVLAKANLERQDFTCFAPRFRKVRRHARKIDTVLAPLFPNYIFIQFDPQNHPWRCVNGTFGVKRLVGFEGKVPRPMPGSAMRAIQARCCDGIVSKFLDELVPGTQVRLVYGPFADSLATIEHLDDKGRISVLLGIMGREVSLRLPGDCLAPA